MPHTDRIIKKSSLFRPCNTQGQTVHCSEKEKEKIDLRLTGSQIHLACRPRSDSGKASTRLMSVSGFRSKRPMSAMPAFGHQGMSGVDMAGVAGWKRPQSADNQYFLVGDSSVSSSATSECEIQNGSSATVRRKQYDIVPRKNKLAAKFPLLGDDIDNNSLIEVNLHKKKETSENKSEGFDQGFGATYTLPTSQLLESLTSEPLGRTWTESELKECCEELGIANDFFNKYEHESLSSDCSNGLCHSERSLGEKIIAMAQDKKSIEPPRRLPLKPGITEKPPLPPYNTHTNSCIEEHIINKKHPNDNNMKDGEVLFEKFNNMFTLIDKSQFLNHSDCSLDMKILEELNENNNPLNNIIDLCSNSFSNKRGVLQKDVISRQNSSLFEDEGLIQYSCYKSQLESEDENEISNNSYNGTLELKQYRSDGNLHKNNVSNDTATDLGDIKFQQWFPDLVCKNTDTSNSHLCEEERHTDLLLEQLAREQCNFDCSDSCKNFTIRARHHEDFDTKFYGKERRKELYLESLVEEDVEENEKDDSSFMRNNESDIKMCIVDNSNNGIKGMEKQQINTSQEIVSIDNCLKDEILSSQIIEAQTQSVLAEEAVNDGKNKGNNVDMCSLIMSDDAKKSAELNDGSRETVTSWLETQLGKSEDDGQSIQVLVDASQNVNQSPVQPRSFDNDKTVLHSTSVLPDLCDNVEHEVLEKSSIVLPQEQRNASSISTTPLSPQACDVNRDSIELMVNSTYEDIVTILKVLEQEETVSFLKLDGLKPTCNSEIPCNDALINPNMLDTPAVSSGKLRDILSYLDEVEHCCDATLESAKSQLQVMKDSTQNDIKLTTMPRFEELLNQSSVDLAHEVLTLRLQLEEKSNSVTLLQETLNQQRELAVQNAKNANRDMKTRLREQKEEYEATVARHQKFIDQLIADKKSLNDKCETLVLELKKSEEHHATTLKTVEGRHAIELQKAREMHAAAEKLRRERWIDNKTQKIKEMTVKGLEPELQRMNTRHQQELADLRLLHKQELEELELRAARKTAQQMEQLRDQLTAEREEALIKEKELLRQRIEKQTEQEELEYQAQRRRFLAEIRREKERLAEEETKLKQEVEEIKHNLTKENAKTTERLKQEHAEAMEACIRRHQNELKTIKDKLETEKEAWINNYKKQQAAIISERESTLRDQYKRDRDKEIELVIERLESEATQSRTEMEQVMDNRLKRLKEKFDAEIKDLESSEKTLKSKYNDTKSKLVEKEDEIISLKSNFRQLEKELEEARKITDRLSEERAEIKEVIRKEFSNQISSAEQENIKLREEMAEMRTRHQVEIACKVDELSRVMAEKERQLQQVYNRVKLAVAKKDETIQKLKIQYESTLEQCRHLEDLLEQQRRNFLLK